MNRFEYGQFLTHFSYWISYTIQSLKIGWKNGKIDADVRLGNEEK